MPDFTLAEEQHNEVIRLSRYYHREAHKCRDSKAYLAGCVMMGAALEASLLAFLNCYPDEVLHSTHAPTRQGATKPLAQWALADLLAVAKERGWLPSGLSLDEEWNGARAQIGDYAEVLRQIRNLVHPAQYTLSLPHKRITKRYLEMSFEIFEVATEYLLSKLNESLRAALEADTEEKNTSNHS
jgi:7,8-dihydro-6-hydroxymethylpterin-pyrophosphokinase